MDTLNKEQLSEIFRDVMERVAFLFADPCPAQDLPQPGDDIISVEMTYEGPAQGGLAMMASLAACREIALNFLGLDDNAEIEDESAHDAFKEILNIMCGQTLTALAGEEPIFQLGMPELSLVNAEQWNALRGDEQTVAFMVEDHPALARFTVK